MSDAARSGVAGGLDAFRSRLVAPLETALASACRGGVTRATEASVRQLAAALRQSPATEGLATLRTAAARAERAPFTELSACAAEVLGLLQVALGKSAPAPAATVAAPAPPPSSPPPAPAPPPPPPPPAPPPSTPRPSLELTVEFPAAKVVSPLASGEHAALLDRFSHATSAQAEPVPVVVLASDAAAMDLLRRQLPVTAAIGRWDADTWVGFFPRRELDGVRDLLTGAIRNTSIRAALGTVPAGHALEPLVGRLREVVTGGGTEPGQLGVVVDEVAAAGDAVHYALVSVEEEGMAAQLVDQLGRSGLLVHRCATTGELLQAARRIIPDVVVVVLGATSRAGPETVDQLRHIRGYDYVPVLMTGGVVDDIPHPRVEFSRVPLPAEEIVRRVHALVTQ